MKVKALIFVASSLVGLTLFWIYGNSIIATGESGSKWISEEMWQSKYFNARRGDLEEFEKINLLSLQDGSSKVQKLITYVVKNKCRDGTERCYVIMTSAANLLVDSGDFDSGIRGVVEANDRVKELGGCPIVFESAILRYKIKKMSSGQIVSVGRVSRELLDNIRQKGGVLKNLRTSSCDSLSRLKPELFHEYVILVSHVMGFAGGDFAKAGAYIQSSVK